MTRHLISATLTPEAYEWYQEWSKNRQASIMISNCIVAHGSGFTEYEQLILWRNTRLVDLARLMISKIPPSRWFEISEEDRWSIDSIARPSRRFTVPQLGEEE
jgi:hypothetical protein